MPFIRLRNFPSVTSFLRVFNMNEYWILSKLFSESIVMIDLSLGAHSPKVMLYHKFWRQLVDISGKAWLFPPQELSPGPGFPSCIFLVRKWNWIPVEASGWWQQAALPKVFPALGLVIFCPLCSSRVSSESNKALISVCLWVKITKTPSSE